MLKHKVYKLNITNNNSMLPGDPSGSPDELLQKVFKVKFPIVNIQVPGMALRGNAGLPIQFIISICDLWRGI